MNGCDMSSVDVYPSTRCHELLTREVAVEVCDAQQVARHREEPFELLLRARAADELAELLSEGVEHLQHRLVGLENPEGKELGDADDLAVEDHRGAERRVEARREGRRLARGPWRPPGVGGPPRPFH